MMQLKLGKRGEIVIPKKIRDQMGLIEDGQVLMKVEGKSVLLCPPSQDVISTWEAQAKGLKLDISNWKYGDQIYEEEFK